MGNAARAMSKRLQSANELALAAIQTVGHRAAMIQEASGDPRAMTNPEIARMSTEKVSAAAAAGSAMLERAFSLQRLYLDLWFGQMRQAALVGQTLLHARSPLSAAYAMSHAAGLALASGIGAGFKAAESAARLVDAGASRSTA